MNDYDYLESEESPRQFPWYLLTGLLLGLGLGLLVSLVISPVRYIDAAPAVLAEEHKATYRLLIAQAYQANPDPVRASQRLALLGDTSAGEVLAEQAQQALSAGNEADARVLAALASALNSLPTPVVIATGAGQIATASDGGASPGEMPQPSAIPSVSPAPVFVLLDQQSVCDATQPVSLLQIVVQDSKGEPVPGVQITIAWDGGLDTFYTGLKPELGAGYADFQMTPGMVYSLRTGNSATINNLSAPECSGSDGNPYPGGWYLLFGQ